MTALKIKIAKFGGSSVADPEGIFQAIDIIRADAAIKAVVLSAAGTTTGNRADRTTELLRRLYLSAAGQGSEDQADVLRHLMDKHETLAAALGILDDVRPALDTIFDGVRATLTRIATQGGSSALRDEMLSVGETLSVHIFAAIFNKKVSVTAADAPRADVFDVRQVMLTDSQYGNAVPDVRYLKEKCDLLLLPKIKAGVLPIIQGYIGQDAQGKTTTLGRGASDYTASLLGEALHADEVQIWTDVAGIYSADPRVVQNARRIQKITLDEMFEFAVYGAGVVMGDALLPAFRSGVSIFVGNTRAASAEGTHIVKTANDNELPVVRGVTSQNNQTLFTIKNPNMIKHTGFTEKAKSVFTQHRINIDMMTTGKAALEFSIDETDAPTDIAQQYPKIQDEILEMFPQSEVTLQRGLTLISVVGNRMVSTPNLLRDILQGVGNGVPVLSVYHGASENSVNIMVYPQDAQAVIVRLHERFVEQKKDVLAA